MAHENKGLDGVVIDESSVSMVDGEAGAIRYRGFDFATLAERSSFPEVLFVLLYDHLPDETELDEFTASLTADRTLSPTVEQTIEALAPHANPMDSLRSAVSMLAGDAEDPNDIEDQLTDHLLSVVAKLPTIVAYTYRYRNDLPVIKPRSELGHAENFLYMFHGEEPDAERARALDTALILYAEHAMNASTFAAIVTASTRANPYAALTSAIGTLQGPLHGGATETVIESFEEIGDPDHVEDWLDARLDANENVPGFGHRVYQVPDPRCEHYRRIIESIGPEGEVATHFEIAKRLQSGMEDRLGQHDVYANTDLYSAIVYELLEIPSAFYASFFASGRVAGWSAHITEQLADNRIFRPRIEYSGETDRQYVPLENR